MPIKQGHASTSNNSGAETKRAGSANAENDGEPKGQGDGLQKRSRRKFVGILDRSDGNEDVSGRNVLAQLYSVISEKPLDASLAAVGRYSDALSLKTYIFFRITRISIGLLYWALAIITFSMAGQLFKSNGIGTWNGLWLLSVATLLLILGLFHARRVWAYGLGIPKVPTEVKSLAELDDPLKEAVNALLQELRKESGIKLHYYWWGLFKLRSRPVDRRVFFGKYCHLLFSEHSYLRRLVPRYGAPFLCSSDVFMRRSDLEAILARLKSEQKAGPGRYSNGIREAALMDLSEQLLNQAKLFRMSEEDAIPGIMSMLSSWYRLHPTKTANAPDTGDLKKQAGGIHRGLMHINCYRQEKKAADVPQG